MCKTPINGADVLGGFQCQNGEGVQDMHKVSEFSLAVATNLHLSFLTYKQTLSARYSQLTTSNFSRYHISFLLRSRVKEISFWAMYK